MGQKCRLADPIEHELFVQKIGKIAFNNILLTVQSNQNFGL